jgi:hypothetical protein
MQLQLLLPRLQLQSWLRDCYNEQHHFLIGLVQLKAELLLHYPERLEDMEPICNTGFDFYCPKPIF